MRLPSRDALEKAAFVASVAVLAFVLGHVSGREGWRPSAFLERAWEQARTVDVFDSGWPGWAEARVHDRRGARTVEPGEVAPGLVLVASTWEDFGWDPGLKLIDREGRTVHGWSVDPRQLFPDSLLPPGVGTRELRYIQGSRLLPGGDVVIHVEGRGTARLDACGAVRWRLPLGGHHSVSRADDGSFWLPVRRREDTLRSRRHPDGYPGLGHPGMHDALLHVSGDGRPLRRISVLDLLYGNGLERFIFKAGVEETGDVTHLNDIEVLSDTLADEYPRFEAGDLLVSLREPHLVFVVDPSDGRVRWHASEPFIRQHDPDFLGDGRIGVFDNNVDGTWRGTALGGSRVVALRPGADATEVLFPTGRSDPLYTRFGGTLQQLEGGNLMLTETATGRVVEVAPDGRTVWEWVQPPYSEEAVPEVFEGTRYRLTREDVAGWPCSEVGRGAREGGG